MVSYAFLFALLFSANSLAFVSELSGIWMGQAPGRNEEKQDIAFQFKKVNGVVSGVMFGDEFDLPVNDLKIEGDKVSFSVTTTNYYSGTASTNTYSGTISARQLQLTRERKEPPANLGNDRPNKKQTITLTRTTS